MQFVLQFFWWIGLGTTLLFHIPSATCAIDPWSSKDFLLRHRASHHFYDVFTKLTGWAALFAWLLLFDDLNAKINFPETKRSLADWGFDTVWFDEILLGWPRNKCSLSFMGYRIYASAMSFLLVEFQGNPINTPHWNHCYGERFLITEQTSAKA